MQADRRSHLGRFAQHCEGALPEFQGPARDMGLRPGARRRRHPLDRRKRDRRLLAHHERWILRFLSRIRRLCSTVPRLPHMPEGCAGECLLHRGFALQT